MFSIKPNTNTNSILFIILFSFGVENVIPFHLRQLNTEFKVYICGVNELKNLTMDQPNFSNTNNSSNPFDLTKTNIKSEFDNQSHETLSDLTENPLPITDPSTQIVPSSVAASAIIGNSPHQEIQPPLQQQQQQPPQPPPQMEKRSPNLSFYSNQNAIKFQGGLSQCLEKLSKQFNSLPNDSLRGRTMYEMYNMAGMGESSCEDEMSEEARNSVLEAILEIECCNTPLRQEIIDAMIASGDQSFNNPLKYEDYCRIESSSKLHQLEIDRMEELKNACMMLRNPYKHVVHKTNQLEDAVKVTEAAIRRLIKMSKRLSAFNRLSQNDQIALLKGSIIEMMCIRATTNFNSENNFWYFIDDNAQGLTMVSMEVLKNANWINFMSHKNFAVKFNSKFKNDPMIADMVRILIIFFYILKKIYNEIIVLKLSIVSCKVVKSRESLFSIFIYALYIILIAAYSHHPVSTFPWIHNQPRDNKVCLSCSCVYNVSDVSNCCLLLMSAS